MPLGHLDNFEYRLYSPSQGEVSIPEPINYEDGNENVYERDPESKGFLKTKKNDLVYHGEGYEFIRKQYASKGIAEDVLQIKRMKSEDRIDERWKIASTAYIDISKAEFDDERKTAKVKATQGGLFGRIDSRISDDFDLVDTSSVTEDDIGPLPTVGLVRLEPKEIFLRSVGTVEEGTTFTAVVSGGDTLNARTFPFQFDINSDAENIKTSFGTKLNAFAGDYAQVTSDRVANLTILNASEKKNLIINGYVRATISDANPGTCTLDSVIYEGGVQTTYKQKTTLDSCNPGVLGDFVEFTFNDWPLELEEGESWALGLLSDTSDGIEYEIPAGVEITITENSGENLVGSNIRAVKPYVALERLVAKITGQNGLVKSSLLEEGGFMENHLLTQGFWVRQFPDIVNEGTDSERKIQFTTSLSDLLEHFDAIRPIAWWTEISGNKEVLRVEALEYTMQNFTGIRYGFEDADEGFLYLQADDVKRKTLPDNFYSSIELGSKLGGDDYEEVYGLQSISGKAKFTTINSTQKSEYKKLSPYRLGDVDVELARRKPYSNFPDTDTRYDSTLMCIDCKVQNGIYTPKQWEDFFESAPTGIYSPDTAYNLEFTPARFLLAHSFVISAGLYHYPSKSIIFASSNCNSSFISKRAGEDTLAEDQPIPHSRLDQPRIRPMSVEFNLKVSQEIEEQITGLTRSGIQNRFGLVTVLTSSGTEYMRLIKVDVNKEGKHTLVEAYI